MKQNSFIILVLLAVVLTMACSSEKGIRKGDQLVAIMEYSEAAKEYKKAYRKISAKERKKRAEVAWKMGLSLSQISHNCTAVIPCSHLSMASKYWA